MDSILTLANGITLGDVNPHNFSLKNGYIANLISSCIPVLPILGTYVGRMRVKMGFMSSKFISDRYPQECHSIEMQLHSKGNAIRVTWDNYDEVSTIDTLIKVMSQLPDDVVDICFFVYHADKSVAIYYGLKEGRVIIEEYEEKGKRKTRTIYSE